MCVHLIGDNITRLSAVRTILEQQCTVTSELLGDADLRGGNDIDAVVVSADLRLVESISALKRVSGKLRRTAKRIFILEQKARLFVVQAYALGATDVLSHPVNKAQLLARLADRNPSDGVPSEILTRGPEAAMAGAACIATMFTAASSSAPIDVNGVKEAGRKIAESIAEDGLSEWLTTVRRHHEGTYQHCLMVTGIAVDFGLSLGVGKVDIERLYTAAMFHDIGKARIPLAVLDKPGRLDAGERALVETHPAAGYEILKENADISTEILDAVRHHHEYLDGSGYPDALCAANISDMVRLLTIADIFAALIEQRSYKPTMPREDAYEIIRSMQGKLEMPLVAAFRDVALTR
jgi:putative nucleotidyltransferase with HDIG domain